MSDRWGFRAGGAPFRAIAAGLVAVAVVAYAGWFGFDGRSETNESLAAFRDEVCGQPPEEGFSMEVTPEICRMAVRSVRLFAPDGEERRLEVLVADEAGERQAGYQHVGEEVIRRSAILFVFPTAIRGAFHMCNVRAPLDIAWFDADGRVVDVRRMKPGGDRLPQLCRTLYAPRSADAYRFALETAAGVLIDDESGRATVASLDAANLD